MQKKLFASQKLGTVLQEIRSKTRTELVTKTPAMSELRIGESKKEESKKSSKKGRKEARKKEVQTRSAIE